MLQISVHGRTEVGVVQLRVAVSENLAECTVEPDILGSDNPAAGNSTVPLAEQAYRLASTDSCWTASVRLPEMSAAFLQDEKVCEHRHPWVRARCPPSSRRGCAIAAGER